ncbi:LysM peptidoglycan-binding domain-containing protein [Leekyejoonella antrihumi]|uniref:LysM peptidoglycan-binding domain-containing protein n=1 Tax=Leekyejoonella antrihumi TaxID=1660198 RepID=UPI001647F727|nr:LysM peptidoglycan-binding domain-containing protein [Leekyejoonella antrihumi]
MSAITVWETPATVTPRRRHLRSMPTGEAALPCRTYARRRLRMTRRGRLMITCSILAALLFGGFGVMRAMAAPAGDAALPTVTVTSGQTLSQIAHRALPQLPIDEAVVRVQVLNRMNTLDVHAGQTLRIPR